MAGLKDLVGTGLPGDDLLVGPDKVHDLTDAFRLHIEQMDPSARVNGQLVPRVGGQRNCALVAR